MTRRRGAPFLSELGRPGRRSSRSLGRKCRGSRRDDASSWERLSRPSGRQHRFPRGKGRASRRHARRDVCSAPQPNPEDLAAETSHELAGRCHGKHSDLDGRRHRRERIERNGGSAIDAEMDRPRNIMPMPDGSYLFTEPFQNDVRRVWPDGTITLFAGNGVAGFTGDGGPAIQAELKLPHATTMLTDGAVLIADNENCRIREVSPAGTISSVAGTGVCGYSGDGGAATSAKINAPRGITALPDGGFPFRIPATTAFGA